MMMAADGHAHVHLRRAKGLLDDQLHRLQRGRTTPKMDLDSMPSPAPVAPSRNAFRQTYCTITELHQRNQIDTYQEFSTRCTVSGCRASRNRFHFGRQRG